MSNYIQACYYLLTWEYVRLVSLLTDSVLGNVGLELPCVVVVIVSTRHFFDELGNLYVDNLIFLSDFQSILLLL